MQAEGRTLVEIRAAVDAKYDQIGRTTDTPHPPK